MDTVAADMAAHTVFNNKDFKMPITDYRRKFNRQPGTLEAELRAMKQQGMSREEIRGWLDERSDAADARRASNREALQNRRGSPNPYDEGTRDWYNEEIERLSSSAKYNPGTGAIAAIRQTDEMRNAWDQIKALEGQRDELGQGGFWDESQRLDARDPWGYQEMQAPQAGASGSPRVFGSLQTPQVRSPQAPQFGSPRIFGRPRSPQPAQPAALNQSTPFGQQQRPRKQGGFGGYPGGGVYGGGYGGGTYGGTYGIQ